MATVITISKQDNVAPYYASPKGRDAYLVKDDIFPISGEDLDRHGTRIRKSDFKTIIRETSSKDSKVCYLLEGEIEVPEGYRLWWIAWENHVFSGYSERIYRVIS